MQNFDKLAKRLVAIMVAHIHSQKRQLFPLSLTKEEDIARSSTYCHYVDQSNTVRASCEGCLTLTALDILMDARVTRRGLNTECWSKNQDCWGGGGGVNDRQSVFTARSYFVQITQSRVQAFRLRY